MLLSADRHRHPRRRRRRNSGLTSGNLETLEVSASAADQKGEGGVFPRPFFISAGQGLDRRVRDSQQSLSPFDPSAHPFARERRNASSAKIRRRPVPFRPTRLPRSLPPSLCLAHPIRLKSQRSRIARQPSDRRATNQPTNGLSRKEPTKTTTLAISAGARAPKPLPVCLTSQPAPSPNPLKAPTLSSLLFSSLPPRLLSSWLVVTPPTRFHLKHIYHPTPSQRRSSFFSPSPSLSSLRVTLRRSARRW